LETVTVTASSVTNILIGLVVLAFILYRQLPPRPVRDNFRLPLILGVVGVTFTIQRVILQARAQRIGRKPRGRPQPFGPIPVKENRARESPRPSRARTSVRRTRWPGLIHMLAENPDKTDPLRS
jgi:hypothetical protein